MCAGPKLRSWHGCCQEHPVVAAQLGLRQNLQVLSLHTRHQRATQCNELFTVKTSASEQPLNVAGCRHIPPAQNNLPPLLWPHSACGKPSLNKTGRLPLCEMSGATAVGAVLPQMPCPASHHVPHDQCSCCSQPVSRRQQERRFLLRFSWPAKQS